MAKPDPRDRLILELVDRLTERAASDSANAAHRSALSERVARAEDGRDQMVASEQQLRRRIERLEGELDGIRSRLHEVHGYVRDSGGGVVTMVVERDTESYPAEGAKLSILVVDQAQPG